MDFELTSGKHTLLEMARVGSIDNIEITIYGGEGPIPHFHFYDKQTERKGCIRLDESSYFDHSMYNDRLKRKEIIKLNDWVRTTKTVFTKFGAEITVFDYMCILWNDNNPTHLIDSLEIPNYLTLNN